MWTQASAVRHTGAHQHVCWCLRSFCSCCCTHVLYISIRIYEDFEIYMHMHLFRLWECLLLLLHIYIFICIHIHIYFSEIIPAAAAASAAAVWEGYAAAVAVRPAHAPVCVLLYVCAFVYVCVFVCTCMCVCGAQRQTSQTAGILCACGQTVWSTQAPHYSCSKPVGQACTWSPWSCRGGWRTRSRVTSSDSLLACADGMLSLSAWFQLQSCSRWAAPTTRCS